MSPAKATQKSQGFTAEEKAAMKERARELKAEARAKKSKADGEQDVLAAIAAMKAPDRALAKRIHALVTANAPDLVPKTWYVMNGMTNTPRCSMPRFIPIARTTLETCACRGIDAEDV